MVSFQVIKDPLSSGGQSLGSLKGRCPSESPGPGRSLPASIIGEQPQHLMSLESSTFLSVGSLAPKAARYLEESLPVTTSSQVTTGKTNSDLRLSVLPWEGPSAPATWQKFRDKNQKFHKWVTGPSASFYVGCSLGTPHEAIGVNGRTRGASMTEFIHVFWTVLSLVLKGSLPLHDGLLLRVPVPGLCYDSVGQIMARAGKPLLHGTCVP